MKKAYINNCRIRKLSTAFICILLLSAILCLSASAAMGLPEGMGRSGGEGIGMENNIPENGNPSISDTVEGNLGDTDGDGIVEDKGTGEGIIGDIGDMGSEIISDIGEAGSEIVSDIGDGVGIGNGADGTNRAPSDSGTANESDGNGGTIIAVVIAIIIVIALIILIIAIIPRNKNKH